MRYKRWRAILFEIYSLIYFFNINLNEMHIRPF